MELNDGHRSALVSEFRTAIDQTYVTNKLVIDHPGEEGFEILDFLAKQRVELISESLIKNDIDY